jgi:hypothetical protein
MISSQFSSQLISLLAAFLIALLIVGLGVAIFGLYKIDSVKPGVAPVFILTGLPVIWIAALDLIHRMMAVRHLARLLELFDKDDMAYMVKLLTDAATLAMVSHTRFETRWRALIEFLNSDYFGSIAAQALFQRSHRGRLKYFKRAARIARSRLGDRSAKGT